MRARISGAKYSLLKLSSGYRIDTYRNYYKNRCRCLIQSCETDWQSAIRALHEIYNKIKELYGDKLPTPAQYEAGAEKARVEYGK